MHIFSCLHVHELNFENSLETWLVFQNTVEKELHFAMLESHFQYLQQNPIKHFGQ
jgi:hypothetical protein